jgi:hypothetical protein
MVLLESSDSSLQAEAEIKEIIDGPLSRLKYWKVEKATFLDNSGTIEAAQCCPQV